MSGQDTQSGECPLREGATCMFGGGVCVLLDGASVCQPQFAIMGDRKAAIDAAVQAERNALKMAVGGVADCCACPFAEHSDWKSEQCKSCCTEEDVENNIIDCWMQYFREEGQRHE